MRTYHILFKFDSISRGENFSVNERINTNPAMYPVAAFGLFREKYPNNIFLGMYDLEALGSLQVNSSAFKEAAEVDDVIRANKEDYKDTYSIDDPPF